MKTKLVLWGSNAQEEKLLIAIELVVEDSAVKVYTFPEAKVTEDFSKLMLDEWRDGKAVEFPEGYSIEERPLSVSSRLLPDELKAEREDVVIRAQTEWHFIVLSAKLNQAYRSELEEFKDRIAKLNKFESGVWEELKAFWSKVQGQVRERNLFKEHAESLKEYTNSLFSDMKSLRSKMDDEFKKASEGNKQYFMEQLQAVEEKINNGMRLQSIFDELKNLQRKFRDTKFTKEHRSKVWEKLDGAFKVVKEKRFGPGANQDKSPVERLQRRFNGLLSAIQKMEQSIKRDEDDLKFQERKIARTDGQLEAQIRQAKIKMIEERIRSKKEKLKEMLSTKIELEGKMASLKKKEEERKERERVQAAKKEAQKKIAKDIKKATAATYDEQSEKLEKAAAALKESKKQKEKPKAEDQPKGDSLLGAAATTLGDAFQDAVDTVKAVAMIMEDKVEDQLGSTYEKVEDSVGQVVDKVKDMFKGGQEQQTEAKEKAQEAYAKAKDKAEEVSEKAENLVEKAGEKLEATAEKIEDKVEETIDKAKSAIAENETASAVVDKVKETAKKAEEAMDKAGDQLEATAEKIEDKIEDAVDKAKAAIAENETASAVVDKIKDSVKKAGVVADKVEDQLEAIAENLEDKVEGVVDKVKKMFGAADEEE